MTDVTKQGGKWVRDTTNLRNARPLRLKFRNQRMGISAKEDRATSNPLYKGTLWKLNQDGEPSNMQSWMKREMWLSKSGALCYFSQRENRDLIYHTAEDMRLAKVKAVRDNQAKARGVPEKVGNFVFEIIRPPRDGMEFEPGWFAAESAQSFDQWMKALLEIPSGRRANDPANAPRGKRASVKNLNDGLKSPASPRSPRGGDDAPPGMRRVGPPPAVAKAVGPASGGYR